DIALNYHTFPVVYGEKSTKALISLLIGVIVIPAFLLINKFDIGLMRYYFYVSTLLLIVFLYLLWWSDAKLHYLLLHNILKFILVLGVFSILLIDPDIVLNRIV
ncbi:MAG: ubiquinone biosynthesis protein UbiA, partial [Bacteroidota bacterium]|nr:ubiquinone biosynthesis protein UbiA [Bacteroidota bacterium]